MSNIKFYAPVDFDDTSSGLTIDGDLAVDTDTLFVDVSADKVGIGIASPRAELEVSGDIYQSWSDAWNFVGQVYQDGSQYRNGIATNSQSRTTQIEARSAGSDGEITFLIGTSEVARMVHGGNVGIGTTSPDQLLHVSGNTKTTNLYVASDIIHDGDTDTKIQFNTDIINFDTAGVERLRITAGGDVGIGTASPDSIVHVEQAKQTLNTTNLDNGTAVGLHLTYPDTTLTGGEGIALAMGMNGRGRSYIANIHQSSNKDASTLAFYTENGGTIAEKLRILPSGNVLIGTTTDSGYKLNVNGTAYASEFDLPSGGKLDWANGDARIIEGDVSNYSLSFQTYTGSSLTTKMFISSGGNVGIGTTSPSATLNVYNTASAPKAIFQHGTTDHLSILIGTSGGGIAVEDNNDFSIFHQDYANRAGETGLTTRFRINSSGNVGIGTTSPDQKLHVHKGSAGTVASATNSIITAENSTSGYLSILVPDANESGILFGRPTSNVDGGILYNSNVSRGLEFRTNGNSAKMVVDSSGNIGIGTTSPSTKLHIEGDGSIIRLQNNNSDTNGTFIDFRDSTGTRTGYVGTTGTSDDMFLFTQGAKPIRFYTNNTERMRISSGGNLLIGTTTDSGYKLNVNGTAFAQTAYVDDYIYHAGDTNTAVGFLDDAIEFYAGGVKMIKLTEGSADVVTVNPDSADVNFQVHGDTVANLLFVDGGTSKVGIGTSSPAYRLDIKGTSNNIGDGNQIFSVGNTAGGTQLAIGSSEDSYTWIRSYESGVGGRDLALVTNGEAVRIKSLGNVLIGTTTDSGQKLQVNGSVLASDYIGSTHIYLSSPDSWIFRSTGGTERMRLTSAGNLGIGTSSPAYKLDVTGELRATSVLRANSNAIVGGYIDLTGDFFHRSDIKVLNKAANNWLIWAQRDTAASEVVVDLNYIGTITPGSDSAYDIGTNTVRFANGYFDTLYGDGSNLTGITATETDTLDSVTGRGATTTNSITVGGLTVDTSTLHVDAANNRVGVGTASPSNKLHIVGDLFLKGSDTSTSTKAFQVQTGNGTSIMDFRNDTYAFFGCGQGGGSASGFIFRWSSTFGVQFTGYNYGNGSSPSYKPILMDTDLVGRSQGVYVNYGITGYTAPAPTTTTEFAVRGRGTSTGYTAKFEDSSTNPLLYIKDNGNVTVGTATDSGYKLDVEGNTNTNGDYYVNGNQGWSGTITINTNPQVSITVEGGIITNVT